MALTRVTAADVSIFAAASTTSAVEEIGSLFEERHLGNVVSSFASSSTLAKQIANGAPVDVYLSASVEWTDYLADRGVIEPGSRHDLLTNRLVLVAPADQLFSAVVGSGFPLAERLGDGRLALGDPDHVPAGIYAKAALQNLGVWPAVANRLAPAANARAALALVERGEVAAGIVYRTDATISPHVRVVGEFPESSHPTIVYPVAMVAGREDAEVERFMQFIRSELAIEVFRRHGFGVLSEAARE